MSELLDGPFGLPLRLLPPPVAAATDYLLTFDRAAYDRPLLLRAFAEIAAAETDPVQRYKGLAATAALAMLWMEELTPQVVEAHRVKSEGAP